MIGSKDFFYCCCSTDGKMNYGIFLFAYTRTTIAFVCAWELPTEVNSLYTRGRFQQSRLRFGCLSDGCTVGICRLSRNLRQTPRLPPGVSMAKEGAARVSVGRTSARALFAIDLDCYISLLYRALCGRVGSVVSDRKG